MDRTLNILQLNIGKQPAVQQSLLNDENLREYTALAVLEPHVWRTEGELRIVPLHHRNWVKVIPSAQSDERWAVRSMLWVRSDITAVQIQIPSPDLTGVVLYINGKRVLLIAVYIPCQNPEALKSAIGLITQAIRQARWENRGYLLDILVVGDFNRHDYLWGGDNTSETRQGEAEPIINLMADLHLQSLLPRGTPTWQRGEHESTIDLVLASSHISELRNKCAIYPIEHGSDHRAISSVFDLDVPEPPIVVRYLWESAPWGKIKETVARELSRQNLRNESVQNQTDRLTRVVGDTVFALTPKAKPSPYTKRWWSTELTELRDTYTYWRNRAKSVRRTGRVNIALENQAKAAAKEYHGAIRTRKKTHWENFLSDNTNIWKAAKYLSAKSPLDRVPPLVRSDGQIITQNNEQASLLLEKFFPPLPEQIDQEPDSPRRHGIPLERITAEEISRAIQRTSPMKAPGGDGLPTIVWKQLWPVIQEQVTQLFNSSLDQGILPSQWKEAKIIPLKKPGKSDYTNPKAWRPISLLSTLGKVLESVLADRISYLVEQYHLLPANHFGARKRRSTEQALSLLQEHIYKAWRAKKVLSLISFDVKGAYNGVVKERLLQRLRARGIPEPLVNWIDSFCSQRTTTITVNGITSHMQQLPQAGLPQGSPLSPILFLFFNADLVQRKIDAHQGGIAFVDDYTAWVTGTSGEENQSKIQSIVSKATEWEKRSGATFEPEKTAYIHFTRNQDKMDSQPVIVRGTEVAPAQEVKILGVIMDTQLRYKKHILRAANRGLQAALSLKRLGMLSPRVARQLFHSAVIPVVDYANTVWMHAGQRHLGPLNRIQRIGGQAVTGAFSTVATAVVEAEASIQSINTRNKEKIIRWWTDLATLPENHPLRRLRLRDTRRFTSPLQRIKREMQGTRLCDMECIEAYAITPWTQRVPLLPNETVITTDTLVVSTTSARNNLIGIGVGIYTPGLTRGEGRLFALAENQNVFSAELYAIHKGLRLLDWIREKTITVQSSCLSALQAIQAPGQQSGQIFVRKIYEIVERLRNQGCKIRTQWTPAASQMLWYRAAKAYAKGYTEPNQDTINVADKRQMRTTTRTHIRKLSPKQGDLPATVGKHIKEVDSALPGRHIERIYNELTKGEAKVLSQLRTGMARVNGYLNAIGATETSQCDHCTSRETVKHFLFQCPFWKEKRDRMLRLADGRWGDISFYLGGKSSQVDGEKWTPNLAAVKATIQYATSTGRLDPGGEGS
jgi:hypothetical protein